MYNCPKREACRNPLGFTVKLERFSLINSDDLYCDWKGRGLFNFMIHFVGGFTIFFICYSSDIFGRKIFTILATFIGILGIILLMMPSGILISSLGMSFGNIYIDFFMIIGFIYTTELLIKLERVKTTMIIFTCATLGSFCSLIVCFNISDFKGVDTFLLISMILLFFITFFMQESLFYLFNHKKKHDFFYTMNLIADINKVNTLDLHKKLNEYGINSAKNKNKNISKYDYDDFSKDFYNFTLRDTLYNKDRKFHNDHSDSESYAKDKNSISKKLIFSMEVNDHSHSFNVSEEIMQSKRYKSPNSSLYSYIHIINRCNTEEKK